MIVCICNNVKSKDIDAAIEDGANTIDAIGESTGAGTCCGKCQFKINRALNESEIAQVQTAIGCN
jgi:bacterioferritin-associated ferredoxin